MLESAAIPIVGEGDSEPKDTYVDQHVASPLTRARGLASSVAFVLHHRHHCAQCAL